MGTGHAGGAGGYAGRALIVDVTGGDVTGTGSRILPLDDRVLRAYLGGVGLGAWLLHRLAPPGVDPLAAQAPLAFVFSPLVGTPLTTSAKFAVVAKSPLTGKYENVFALGPMCGVSDPDDVLAASARCDELGLDTISAGGTIAWAMECAQRGLLDAPWLRFGDGAALLRALDEIGSGDGLGTLLAEGSRRAAAVVGGGSQDFAPHVKGMELPGYEPRTLQGMALGLAVNARGADHNRSGAYEADLSGAYDRLAGGDAQVAAAVATEDRAAVMDSMILCKFLRGVFNEPYHEWAALLRVVTGSDVDAAELSATARRIVLAKRMFNLREGWTRADDWLPARLLREPVRLGSGREAALTPDRLREMIDGYYAARGLDPDGRPDDGALADLLVSA